MHNLNKVKSLPKIKVSVIVCTLGRTSLIDCLESVYNQNYKNLELIIVSPTQDVKKTISRFEKSESINVKFVLSDKANVSIQRNMGIVEAVGDVIAFIDDDAVADKDWIKNLVAHYDEEKVVCVGGKIIPKFLGELSDELKKLPKEILRGFLGETLLDHENATTIDRPLLWGSNISFRKDVFDIVGLFDEKLGKTSDKLLAEEEIDIQTRILERGYKIVYEPKSFVIHLIPAEKLTKNYFIKRAFWQGYSEMIKIRKYEEFQKAVSELKTSYIEYINNIKLLELFFELASTTNFEKVLNKSYELGRIVALSSLIKTRLIKR